jgi:hypothetical protein
VLTPDVLAPVVVDAIDIWSAAPLSAAQQRALAQFDVRIADLPGAVLGQTLGSTIWIDVNAAGWGWSVDKGEGQRAKDEGQNGLPTSDFRIPTSIGSPLSALDCPLSILPPSAFRIPTSVDLVSVVMHELGHILGFDDDYSDANSTDLMNGWLSPGVRREFNVSGFDRVFGDPGWLDELHV